MYIRDFLDAAWVLPKAGVMGRAVNAAQDIQRSVKTGVKVVTDVPSNIARKEANFNILDFFSSTSWEKIDLSKN